MKRILVAAASAAIAAFSALAADADYTAETGYVTAIRNGGSWLTATTWSSGMRPVDLTVATNYYIGTAYQIYMLNYDDFTNGYATVKFPADGSKLFVAGTCTHTGNIRTKPYYGDITFLPGSTLFYNSVGEILSGDFTILGTAESPVKFSIQRTDSNTYTLSSAANFHSDATGYMWLCKAKNAGFATSWQNFKYSGDWTGFYGTYLCPTNDGIQVVHGFDTPGTFLIPSNCIFQVVGNNAQATVGRMDVYPHGIIKIEKATGKLTVGTLDIASDGIVSFASDLAPAIHVTNRLTLADGVVAELQASTLASKGSNGSTTDVFRLSPQAVAAGVPDVSRLVPVQLKPYGVLPRLSQCLYDDPTVAGGKIIGFAAEGYVAMTNTCLASKSALDLKYNHPEEYWSDGNYPSAGKDYLLSAQLLIVNNVNPYVFPGRSCVANSVTIGMYANASDVTFTNLYVTGGSNFRPMSSATSYFFRGNIYFFNNNTAPVRFHLYNKSDFTMASKLHGEKNIIVAFQDQAKPAAYGASMMNVTCRLAGDNINYTGKIYVTTTNDAYRCTNGSVVAFDAEHTITLRVTAPENLGGPLGAFAYDSLTISNQCRLAIDATATFADTTRGWNFPRTAYLFVTNGATATCRNTFTIGGNLVKEGEGTLVLAAKPVADGAGASITVTNGTLAVGLSDALDDLPATFAEGTSLGLDMSSADATFAEKGLALASTDITCASGGLVLSLCGMPANPEDAVGIAYPLLTYPSAQAAAVAATYSVRNPYPQTGYVVRLFEVPNGDDTVTLKANIRLRGTHLIVR